MLSFDALALDLIAMVTTLDKRDRPPIVVIVRCVTNAMIGPKSKPAFYFIDKNVTQNDFSTLLPKWKYKIGDKPPGGFQVWLQSVLDMFGTEVGIHIDTKLPPTFTVIR